MLPVHTAQPRHRISLDLSSKRQHVVRLGAEFDVMNVYKALNSTGLVRAFEMSGKLRAKLLDLYKSASLDFRKVIRTFASRPEPIPSSRSRHN
jgi:hypothetical protein